LSEKNPGKKAARALGHARHPQKRFRHNSYAMGERKKTVGVPGRLAGFGFHGRITLKKESVHRPKKKTEKTAYLPLRPPVGCVWWGIPWGDRGPNQRKGVSLTWFY